MMDNSPINFIYTHKMVNIMGEDGDLLQGQGLSSYQILYFFSETEKLSWDLLRDIYEGCFGRTVIGKNTIGPFEGLEELNQFTLSVCTEIKAQEAYLLSVNDYNRGLETISEIRHFRNIFSSQGKKLVNPAFRPEKSTFFKRIFRDG